MAVDKAADVSSVGANGLSQNTVLERVMVSPQESVVVFVLTSHSSIVSKNTS